MNSALQSAAAHGSSSYGMLPAHRLRDVLLGAIPTGGEKARVFQALSETPPYRLATLAREIGISFDRLEDRFQELFQVTLTDVQQWKPGGH